jgi:hypothetical protein
MKDIERIKRIATNVRKWAEKKQIEAWDNGESWKYTKDLNCLCAIASWELFKRLKRAKFDPEMCFSDHGHAFILCNKLLVDVTATQFNSRAGYQSKIKFKKVEIRPAMDRKLSKYWFKHRFGKEKKTIAYIMKSWPHYQMHPEIAKTQERLRI